MHSRRMCATLLLVLAVLGTTASPAFALGAEVDTAAGAAKKLFRGVANVVTGWAEIPKQVTFAWQEGGAGMGMTWGLLRGVGFAVARTAVGGYEVATFPMPIPDGYRPIMEPEFVLSDVPARPSTPRR